MLDVSAENSNRIYTVSYVVMIGIPLLVTLIGIFRKNKPGSKEMRKLGCFFTFAAFIFAAMTVPCTIRGTNLAKRLDAKAAVHAIDVAITRYSEDHQGHYPEDLLKLFDEDYITRYPDNVYTGEQMRQVEFHSPDYEGNFTYIPVSHDGEVTGYCLIGYSNEEGANLDIDGDNLGDNVEIVIDSDSDKSEYPGSLPPLSELLSVYQPDI